MNINLHKILTQSNSSIYVITSAVFVTALMMNAFALSTPAAAWWWNNDKPKKANVKGKTIKSACKTLKDKGWKISSVDGVDKKKKVVSSNCGDSSNKVSDVKYKDGKVTISYTFTPSKDKTIAQIEKKATSDGTCKYKNSGSVDKVLNADQLGTSATTEFINLGIKLFKRDTCKKFGYQIELIDGKKRNIILQFNASKKQFSTYDWKNLEGRVVGPRLQTDGIITAVDNSTGLNPEKFELYTLN